MFSKKVKKQSDIQATAVASPDFVVRNMPKTSSLSGISYQTTATSSINSHSNQQQARGSNNFKKVGIIIIAAGLIICSVLVYLSYRFLIKPSAQSRSGIITPSLVDNSLSNNSLPILDVTTTTAQAVVVVATSTVDLVMASSSIDNLTDITQTSSTDPIIIIAPVPVIDEDSDGLNNDEEVVLGTNPNSLDSDGDTYTDLAEINNGYDPIGLERLEYNINLQEYANSVGSYRLFRPKTWEIEALDDNNTVIFTAPDNSLIQISVQKNINQQSIVGWYGSAFPTSVITYDKLNSHANWEGIFSDDGLNFYLTDDGQQYIYVISYISADGRLVYPNIFQLMINSLQID